MSNSSKSNLNINAAKSPLSFLEEGVLVDWFANNGKYVAYGLIGLLILFVIFYRFSNGHLTKSEQDFSKAAQDFAIFTKIDATDQTQLDNALARLNALMDKHPELHAAYDGTIAQTLLFRGQSAQATPYMESTLARTKSNDLPYYNEFGANTLLINANNYQAALEKSQALQQKMITALSESTKEKPFGEELFAINLFRIGMIQQQLGDKAGELTTWQQWKQYSGLDNGRSSSSIKIDAQIFRAIIQQLAIGNISIPDYINYRETVLKK